MSHTRRLEEGGGMQHFQDALAEAIADVDEIAVRGASCCHVPSEATQAQILLDSLYEYAAAARPATGTSASEHCKQ